MNHVQTNAAPVKMSNSSEFGMSLPADNSGEKPEDNKTISNNKKALSEPAQGYLYAIGDIDPVFPSVDIEKEFNRVTVLSKSAAFDDQLLYDILSRKQYRYIAAEMRWVMKINKVNSYLIIPRGAAELDVLINSLKQEPGKATCQAVIGRRGKEELTKPGGDERLVIVDCDLLYNVAFDKFADSIADKIGADKVIVGGLFNQLLNREGSAGVKDEDRAVNYIALKYLDAYKITSEMLQSDSKSPIYSFVNVDTKSSRVQGTRKIVDVTFNYKERATGEIIWKTAKVDTTDLFPFLVKGFEDDHPRP